MSRVGRENAKQCSSKATPCSSPEGFGELRQVAHGIGVQKIFCRSSLPFQGGCIRSQLHSRPPDGGRMSSGSVVYSHHRVQAQCRHSLNSFAEGPACRCWVRNWAP